MPNRILRDWTCSETMNEVSEFAEIFFTRLIMKSDDFGRFYGSSKLLKAQLFPLKDYSFKNVEKWRDECVKSGLVILYVDDGKEYLEIVDFGQRLRLMKSKFPEPKTIMPSNDGQLSDKRPLETKRNETENEVETETEVEGVKNKNEIPSLIEFMDYCLSIEGINTEPLRFSIQAKYEAWTENKWRDGNNSPIKNWKTKIKNTIPHLKPVYNGNSNNSNAIPSLEEQARRATEAIFGSNNGQNEPDRNASAEDIGHEVVE